MMKFYREEASRILAGQKKMSTLQMAIGDRQSEAVK